MSEIKLTKANIGDTIVIRGVVHDVEVENSNLLVLLAQYGMPKFWIPVSTEIELIDRPFKEGDEVTCYGQRCTVRSIDGEDAWVKLHYDQSRLSVKTASLKRIES